MDISNMEKLGSFDVDSGLVWIGDPGYHSNKCLFLAWDGDGTYSVYAKRDKEGYIEQIVIDFVDEDYD